MGRLWEIIETHMDSQKYRPSQADIARAMGLKSATTLTNWKNDRLSEMPAHEHLWAVVDLTGASIHRVLDAALIDAGYYERGGRDAKRPAAISQAEVSSAEGSTEDDAGLHLRARSRTPNRPRRSTSRTPAGEPAQGDRL